MKSAIVLALLAVLPLAMGAAIDTKSPAKRRDSSPIGKVAVDLVRVKKQAVDDEYDYQMCDGSDDDDDHVPAKGKPMVAAPAPKPAQPSGSDKKSLIRDFLPKIIDTVKPLISAPAPKPAERSGSGKKSPVSGIIPTIIEKIQPIISAPAGKVAPVAPVAPVAAALKPVAAPVLKPAQSSDSDKPIAKAPAPAPAVKAAPVAKVAPVLAVRKSA